MILRQWIAESSRADAIGASATGEGMTAISVSAAADGLQVSEHVSKLAGGASESANDVSLHDSFHFFDLASHFFLLESRECEPHTGVEHAADSHADEHAFGEVAIIASLIVFDDLVDLMVSHGCYPP